MSRAETPSESVKAVAGDDCEITRLAGSKIGFTLEQNDEQSLVTVPTDGARAVITVDEPGVDVADAIEDAYEIENGLNRLLSTPFGGETDG